MGLALLGTTGLDSLNDLAQRGDDALRKRIRNLLRVGMLKTIRWKEVERQPSLRVLVEDDVNRGFTLLEDFALLTDADLGDSSREVLGEVPGTKRHAAFTEFRKLGGCGVPALQKLGTHPNPIARAYAILLLEQVEATIGKADVRQMETDTARVRVFDGESLLLIGSSSSGPSAGRPIGERAKCFLQNQPLTDSCPMRLIEGCVIRLQSLDGVEELYPDLTTGIGQYALREKWDDFRKLKTDEILKIQSELDWDTWWRAAGPVWKIWDETGGGKKSFNDRQTFHNWLRRRTERFTLERTMNVDGKSLLRVEEPVGGFCSVYHNGNPVAWGPIPFETTKTDPRSMTVKASAPDAKPWEVTLASNVGWTFVVRFYKERLD